MERRFYREMNQKTAIIKMGSCIVLLLSLSVCVAFSLQPPNQPSQPQKLLSQLPTAAAIQGAHQKTHGGQAISSSELPTVGSAYGAESELIWKKLPPADIVGQDNQQRSFIAENRGKILLALFFATCATISASFVPLIFSRILTALTAPVFKLENLLRALLWLVACHTFEPLMTMGYVRTSVKLVDAYIARVRTTIYRNVLQRDISRVETKGEEDPAAVVLDEVERLKLTAMQNITRDRGFRAVLELLVGLAVMFKLCFPLALMFSVTLPVTAYITTRCARGVIAANIREGQCFSRLSFTVKESIANFKEVFSFSNQRMELLKLLRGQSDASDALVQIGVARSIFEACNRTGIYANIVAMFAFGGYLISKELIKPLLLVSFLNYCFSLSYATQGVLNSYGDFKSVSKSWQQVSKLLQSSSGRGGSNAAAGTATAAPANAAAPAVPCATIQKENQQSKALAKPAIKRPMTISFEGVGFSYPSRTDIAVLKAIDLRIPAGKKVALVGSSGAGKSTIANLLNRFYYPSRGRILIDGQDMHGADLTRDEYLRRVSLVRQTPSLFTDTIAGNIAYGAVAYRDVSLEDIIAAAKAANAHDFIMELPDGYNTMIGAGVPGAIQLSGGQSQRIAIARAILKDADLLVLDESTSALDSESEALVQESLDRLMEGKTTVIIAHRLSTVLNADMICAMKDGSIREIGTHDQLMRSGGLYYQLMSTQINSFTSQPECLTPSKLL